MPLPLFEKHFNKGENQCHVIVEILEIVKVIVLLIG